jgi:hypothetical protein
MVTRTLSEPEKKIVAHRQDWKCSGCQTTLPAAYQVDHSIPLWAGGEDTIDNATAMCPNCHCAKTQHEAADRAETVRKRAETAVPAYADRWDHYSNGAAVCGECRQARPEGTPHLVCWAIERAASKQPPLVALDRFRFTPRRPADSICSRLGCTKQHG